MHLYIATILSIAIQLEQIKNENSSKIGCSANGIVGMLISIIY